MFRTLKSARFLQRTKIHSILLHLLRRLLPFGQGDRRGHYSVLDLKTGLVILRLDLVG